MNKLDIVRIWHSLIYVVAFVQKTHEEIAKNTSAVERSKPQDSEDYI